MRPVVEAAVTARGCREYAVGRGLAATLQVRPRNVFLSQGNLNSAAGNPGDGKFFTLDDFAVQVLAKGIC